MLWNLNLKSDQYFSSLILVRKWKDKQTLEHFLALLSRLGWRLNKKFVLGENKGRFERKEAIFFFFFGGLTW